MIEIKQTDLKIIKTLQKIKEVKVYYAKVKFNHLNVCVKQIKTDSHQKASLALHEAFSLALIKHPNVVNFYYSNLLGKGSTLTHYSIIMEYFELRDLGRLIEKRKNNNNFWSEATIFYYADQLISALAYLQERNFSHRDIKPENILVSNSGRFLKVSDFGGCTKVNKSSLSFKGTPNYLSPKLRAAYTMNHSGEIKFVEHNVYKSDVFSLGLILLYMASFKDPSNFIVLSRLGEDINNCIEDLGGDYINLKKYLKALLMIDENNRLDFIQLNELREEMIKNNGFTSNKFCIKCQNYILFLDFIQIYGIFYCESCTEIIKNEEHKCLNCKETKKFKEVYLFENKPYCKECLSLESLKVLPLYCSICRDDINDNCTCNCDNILRCKVCKLRRHEGVNCIRNAERMIDYNFEALYKCECENFIVRQENRFFYYCRQCENRGSKQKIKSYCWVCGKSEDKDHPLCRVYLEYSDFLK